MSTPPFTPVGGGAPPNPPYDPKTQWRVYRAQQKAAWRAQRDAWKAQQYAMKSSYVGAYGPRVPSLVGPVLLIGIGVGAAAVVVADQSGAIAVDWRRIAETVNAYIVDGVQRVQAYRREVTPPPYPAAVEGDNQTPPPTHITLEEIQRIVYSVVSSPIGAGVTVGAVYALCR